MLRDVAVILAGYLIGSIPFAFLITKLVTGKDLRFEGEGNVGARNALHVAGPIPGVLTALLDMGKGAAAHWVASNWASGEIVLYATGFAVMLGHGFPLWLGWRGGNGLEAAFGLLLPMWPYSVLATGAIFFVARSLIPDFNRAFAVAGAAFPLLTRLEGNSLRGAVFIIFLLGMAGGDEGGGSTSRAGYAGQEWLDRRAGSGSTDAPSGRVKGEGKGRLFCTGVRHCRTLCA